MEHGISLELVLKRSIRDWWILVLSGLIGAGIGWIIFMSKTPQYQAEGLISIGIDFTRTGQLSDIEEDQMLGIIGDILSSPSVISSVVSEANSQQIALDESTFKQISKAERRQNQWVLIVRSSDPVTANAIAELWTKEGYSKLVTAMEHAERAGHLQRYLDSLESCLQKTSSSNPASGVCGIKNVLDLQKDLDETGKLMMEDKTASMGMLPGTTVTLASLPEQSKQPVEFRQGALILVGCLAGLLLGTIGLIAGWTDGIYRFRAE